MNTCVYHHEPTYSGLYILNEWCMCRVRSCWCIHTRHCSMASGALYSRRKRTLWCLVTAHHNGGSRSVYDQRPGGANRGLVCASA